MRLQSAAWATRDFKRSLRPDATNPVIIVVPDRLAAYRLKDPRLGKHIAKLWVNGSPPDDLDADFCRLNNTTAFRARVC